MNKESEPLVSLVAVCHNHKSYLMDSIHSMVKQSYRNKEIIVYDNGSTDGSREVLQKLQKTFGFELICQENIGSAKAANKAVLHAKGKYISFLSTDDYWALDKIEIAVNFMERCDERIAVCGGCVIKIDKNGKMFRKQTFADYHELDFREVFVNGKNIPALTSLIRKSVLENIGNFDERHDVEDASLWLKITHNNYKIAYLNKLLGYYRLHDTNFHKRSNEIIGIFEQIYGAYSEHPLYNKAISNFYFRRVLRYIKTDKKLAFKLIRKVKIQFINLHMIKQFIFYFLMSFNRTNE